MSKQSDPSVVGSRSGGRPVTSGIGSRPRRIVAAGLDEPLARATAPQAGEQRA